MKAIVILYDGVTPNSEDVKNGIIALGILPEDAQVKLLTEHETSSVVKASALLGTTFSCVEDNFREYEEVDKAADIIIRMTGGTEPTQIAKKIVPITINTEESEMTDTARELVKAIRLVSSGKSVSNGWLRAHGLTRLQWNQAKQFISGLID